MRKYLSFIVFAVISNYGSGQIHTQITEKGEVLVFQFEPTHYLFVNPLTRAPLNVDTSVFGNKSFQYIPQIHYTFNQYLPFPNFGVGDYTILDSIGTEIIITDYYWCGTYGHENHIKYNLNLVYDKQYRLKKLTIEPHSKVDSSGCCITSKSVWKYYHDKNGVKKITINKKRYVEYSRTDEGRLNYYIAGSQNLNAESIYIQLNNKITKGNSSHETFPDLDEFIMFKYKNGNISEFITYERNSPVAKINLSYNSNNQLTGITECWEDDVHCRTVIKLEYDSLSSKINSITRVHFADNWENIITNKYKISCSYRDDKISLILIEEWDSYNWENQDVYDLPATLIEEVVIY